MTHDPLCGLSQPCDDETPEHGYCSMQHGEFCIHCHQWCVCDVIAKVREDALADAVQRVEAQIRFWFDVAPDGRLHIHPSDVGEYLFRAAVIAAIKGDQECPPQLPPSVGIPEKKGSLR
jgi:hypothetical protein